MDIRPEARVYVVPSRFAANSGLLWMLSRSKIPVDSNPRIAASVMDLVTEGMPWPGFISVLDAISSPIHQVSSTGRC